MDGSQTIDPTGYIKSRGLKFPKDGTYLTGKVRGLLRSGDYERDMAAAALKATREGDTVLDLGCGLGFTAGRHDVSLFNPVLAFIKWNPVGGHRYSAPDR